MPEKTKLTLVFFGEFDFYVVRLEWKVLQKDLTELLHIFSSADFF